MLEIEKYLFFLGNVFKVYFISIFNLKASFFLETIKLTIKDKSKNNLQCCISTIMFLLMLEKTEKKKYGLLNFTKIYCSPYCTWPGDFLGGWRPETIAEAYDENWSRAAFCSKRHMFLEVFGSSAMVWKAKSISPIFIFEII